MLIAKNRWMVGHIIVALFISYIVFPGLLFILENLVQMVAGVVFVAIIAGFLALAFFAMIVESGESSGGASYSRSKNSASNSEKGDDEEKKRKQIKERGSIVKEKDRAYVPYYKSLLGFKLYKVKGIIDPDYVETESGSGSCWICTLEMLKKGQFHIYVDESGSGKWREIKESEIPWLPD